MNDPMPDYKYGGARALVRLHERHLREFVSVWKKARALDLALPQTSDPSYESLEALLRHVLRAARGYMTWICESLELGDPGISETPAAEHIAEEADAYLGHVLEKWRTPLAGVSEERFEDKVYRSRWGSLMSIESMLEHAVMHPIRHAFQLSNLLETRTRGASS